MPSTPPPKRPRRASPAPRARRAALAACALAVGSLTAVACGTPTLTASGTNPGPPTSEGTTNGTTRDGSPLRGLDAGQAAGLLVPAPTDAPTTAPPETTPTTSIGVTLPPVTTRPPVTAPPTTSAPVTMPPPPPVVTNPPNPGKPPPSPISESQLTSDEQYFLGRLNSYRASRGLPGLTPEGELVSLSRSHSQSMAAAGTLSNTPNLFEGVTHDFSSLTELVARGPNNQFIADNMLANSQYTSTIAGPFAYVGIGVTTAGGLNYVTIRLGA